MNEAPIMLHLGCAHRTLPGFIHIDGTPYPHLDYVHKIDVLPMVSNDSASLLYASHCFEYFDREDAPRVLAEWRRCLMPGGILRLAVPDMDRLIEVYQQTGELKRILGPMFGRWGDGDAHIYHKTVYNQSDLTALLSANGFTDIERWDWRVELPDSYDDYSKAHYPHMDFEKGLCISLNLQARRCE